jgi:ATP/maltotriose-dependent transcriptional regulator MalT/DNA-binding SARP family transcriptional activator
MLARPELEGRLQEALTRRLTIVVGGAGFGKSTLLGAWFSRVHGAWYTLTPDDAAMASLAGGLVQALRAPLPDLPPDLLAAIAVRGPDPDADDLTRAQAGAARLCEALRERLDRDLVLVLDDVHEVGAAAGPGRLIEAVCRQAPPTLHLVLASRTEPPFAVERLRGQGQVLEISGADLAFTVDDVAALLAEWLGDEAVDLAGPLREATGGWPAAVRLAVEALRGVSATERSRALEGIRRPGGPLIAYLAGEVFGSEPTAVRDLIRTMAPLERLTPALCEALGIRQAAETLASLTRRGLLVEPRSGADGWFSLHPLVRHFARESSPLSAEEERQLHGRAARWFAARGHLPEALRAFAAAGEQPAVAGLLRESGPALFAAGEVDAVVRADESLPPDLRDASIEQIVGQALQLRGDWEGALTRFRRAAAGAAALGPALAWRLGLIHHMRGELNEALAVYGRGSVDGSEPRDEALLLAWRAAAHGLRGDAADCQRDAASAAEAANASGDSQALAAAHTALALLAALVGDRRANDAHYRRALEHAERVGDVLQVVRIRTNLGSRLVEEGAYEEALAELDRAIQLADLAGYASLRALALANRGEAQFCVGRLEAALADLEAARALYQGVGSRMVCYPLQKLGDIYRERGDAALSRAAYEEAVGAAEQSGDVQGLVPALAGLARVLADEEPDEARRLAERAVALGPGMGHVGALLAAGWVGLLRGDRVEAEQRALSAAAEARARRDRAGLAEALQLRGEAASEAADGRRRLEEAIAIWQEVRSPLGEARATLALARAARGPIGRSLAQAAGQRLRALGARGHAAAAGDLLASLDAEVQPAVAIQSLGAFRVLRRGKPVSLVEWQSKKARDLLKMLLARRGLRTPRDVLMEALWPEEDPDRVANRLSVALTIVRAVLDPDRRLGPDHFVVADRHAVGLEVGHLAIDLETFLADADAGLALQRQGRTQEAAERLTAAEAAYAGDFLEEDAYEDWAVPPREEARAVYISLTHVLAEHAAARADHDAATRYFLRILERDRYDERAHLGLVQAVAAAGRHGEARRFYRLYAARMAELGVEASPFPDGGRSAPARLTLAS